jgi:hypothetical protein
MTTRIEFTTVEPQPPVKRLNVLTVHVCDEHGFGLHYRDPTPEDLLACGYVLTVPSEHDKRTEAALSKPSAQPSAEAPCPNCKGEGFHRSHPYDQRCLNCEGLGNVPAETPSAEAQPPERQPSPSPEPGPSEAQRSGGTCWLIEIKAYSGQPAWLDRGAWRRVQRIVWITSAANALSFPTQAEAIMFAREYLPGYEGRVVATEHEFV